MYSKEFVYIVYIVNRDWFFPNEAPSLAGLKTKHLKIDLK
jgi:hypothetical protein